MIPKIIKNNRQTSYAYPKKKDVPFSIGDMMFIKVSLMKDIMRFSHKGKLAPRYIRPFEIQSRVGDVAL